MEQFSPLLFLSMGWLGLFTGLFFGFQDMKRFSRTVWMYAGIDSLLIFAGIFMISFLFIYVYSGEMWISVFSSIALSIAASYIVNIF